MASRGDVPEAVRVLAEGLYLEPVFPEGFTIEIRCATCQRHVAGELAPQAVRYPLKWWLAVAGEAADHVCVGKEVRGGKR